MTPQPVSWRRVSRHWEIYLFILPALLLIAVFQYYPAGSGVFHSFFRWNGADISEFVGWDNYVDLVSNPSFWLSFKVALILGLWNIVKMIPPLAVAVCIHRCRSARMQFFYRALFVVPMVVPALVIALVWRSFFFEATTGYLNQFLNATHLFDVLVWLDNKLDWGGVFQAGKSPAWLGDPRLILVALIVWGFPWVGSFAVLTHLAKLQNIPRDIYEAAEIDGVSWWSKFTRIELPLILSSIYLLLVFVVIDTLKDAGIVLALAGFEGGPGGVVTVPALFMIRKAFAEQQMGYACAVGIVLTLVVMVLQKLSTAVVDWEQYTPLKRRLYAAALTLLGLGIAAFVSAWFAVFVTVVAICIVIVRIIKNSRHRRSEAQIAQPPRNRMHERGARARKAQGFLLRAAKHSVIWLVLIFAMLPMYLMLIVSIKDNNQFYEAPARITEPAHWENWQFAWRTILPSVANSVFLATITTAICICLALAAAYFFARLRMPLSAVFWNAILVLLMMPAIANLIPLFRLLKDINLLNTLSALILVGASGGIVFAVFVFRSFLADLPGDLFESAEIDGASHFQQLSRIVLPLVGPVVGTVGVMQFISTWNDFILPLIVIRDNSKLPVMVALLRLAGEYIKLWGPMMAGYAIASVPIIVLFVFSMRLFVRGLTEGAVKG